MSIFPHQLPDALANHPASILSLDCFDTLLWRHGHRPTDVFADFGPDMPVHDQRVRAESEARGYSFLSRGAAEVHLPDIYARAMPNGTPEDWARAAAAEVAAEQRHCYGFAPTIALMRNARAQGARIIIVSDTYLNEAELRGLIAAAAGPDVAQLIDRIFCSADYGVGKPMGLFRHVLDQLKVAPADILHIGDNHDADWRAPTELGIQALHLRQFSEETEQRLRLEANAFAMLHGSRRAQTAWQPHRARIAIAEPQIGDPAAILGYSVMGPLFATFDRWLKDEASRLAAARPGGRVHALFLLRDGHLPHAMWEASGGHPDVAAHRVEISRFTSIASSFMADADVRRHLSQTAGTGNFASIAKQLLFTKSEAKAMGVTGDDGKLNMSFLKKMQRRQTIDQVLRRSRAFGNRLIAHVRAACDPQPGDTLMLVDLGYNGTVQNAIEPLFAERLGVHVAGRYMILKEDQMTGHDKAGLFDQRHYDVAALATLVDNIAAVEQLATMNQGSVVDYTADGAPIRADNHVADDQGKIRDLVQLACLEYGKAGFPHWAKSPASDTEATRRAAAAAVLARFTFLPLESELKVLEQFDHDVNLGGAQMVRLFDRAGGAEGLRRHGLFYMKNASRMFQPAELRGQGLPLSLALFSQRRLALELRRADFEEPTIELPIIIAEGGNVSMASVSASRTHDGFFAAAIPVGDYRFSVGVQFGRLYEWVEIRSADFVPANGLLFGEAVQNLVTFEAKPSLEGFDAVSGGLVHCTDPAGFMMIPPAGKRGGPDMVLTVVFRPIVARADDMATPATPAEAVRAA
jgi:FMN phosphatase YigB (HAD superfamily)